MVLTSEMINYMPIKLKAFRKYIEKYDCVYWVNGVSTIMFYHKDTGMPYVMLIDDPGTHFVKIYVNYQADNWARPGCTIREENSISNDMNAFILAIRECKESNNG